jgi:hypothetical protein
MCNFAVSMSDVISAPMNSRLFFLGCVLVVVMSATADERDDPS